MKQETITIKGETYKVGFSFKAFEIYETIEKQSINQATGTRGNIVYVYSVLKAFNDNFDYTLAEFYEILAEDKSLLVQLIEKTRDDDPQPEETPAAPGKKKSSLKIIFGLWTLSLLLLASPILLPITFGVVCLWLSTKQLIRYIAKAGKKPA